jgi:uncharacterized membrane protein (DUF106 family)
MVDTRACMFLVVLILSAIPGLAQAVSKDAQELMALREKRAPLECKMTKLYSQVRAAQKAGDRAKVEALMKQMHEVDDKLRADSPRVAQLMRRVRNTPDHKAILEQQVKFDKACQ